MVKKLFTLEEANALLPRLKEDLRELQDASGKFETLLLEYQKMKAIHKQAFQSPDGKHDPFFETESRLEFMKMETDLLIENFKRKGVLLKMVSPGLIDFPAELDGEEVLICWKEGEERATHYHGWHDGFAGRKPYPEEGN